MIGARSLVLAGLVLLAAPAAAGATPLLAVTSANQLVSFDSTSPQTTTVRTIAGLSSATESIVGIDRRPSNGQIYLATAPNGLAAPQPAKLYVLDPEHGQAALVGTSAAVTGFADLAGGVDFNPGADRLRFVNVNEANFRLNPNDVAISGIDTNLTPAGDAVGVAYDNLAPTATTATAYVLDRATSALLRLGGPGGALPSPNGGALTTIGPLGFTLDGVLDAGFDIAPNGTGFVAATTGGTTGLFTINLGTGAMTSIGPIGPGAGEIVGLTALPDTPAPTVAAPTPGPTGPAGAPGAPGAVTLVDRLVTLLADDRLTGRAGRTLTVTVVSSIRATISLDLRKGTKSVRKVAGTVKAGRTRIKITRLPAAGSYTIRLTATAGAQRATDRGKLTLKR